MCPVGRQHFGGERQGALGLAHVAEGGRRGVKFVQPGRQRIQERLPRRRFAVFG